MSELSAPYQLPSTEDTTNQKLSLLEDVGSAVIDVMHSSLKKARKLPFPVGRSVRYVEDTLSPLLDPMITSVEEEGLHLLSLADRKINAAAKHIPLAPVFITSLHIVLSGQVSVTVQSGLEQLRRRGLVGCTADALVKYEPVMRSSFQVIYELVKKVPGSYLAVYFLHDIGSPLVSTVSDWVINHSENKGKHQDFFTDDSAESSLPESPAEELDDSKMIGNATDSGEHSEEHATQSQEHPEENVTESHIISSTPDDYSVNSAETTEFQVTEGSASQMSLPADEAQVQGSATADPAKGKVLHITPPKEEPEEHDEILDLFDTWGLGLTAISPKGLDNLRTLSLQDRSDRETTPKSKSKSVSFKL